MNRVDCGGFWILKDFFTFFIFYTNDFSMNRVDCGGEVNEACRAAAITTASGEVQFERMCCKVCFGYLYLVFGIFLVLFLGICI